VVGKFVCEANDMIVGAPCAFVVCRAPPLRLYSVMHGPLLLSLGRPSEVYRQFMGSNNNKCCLSRLSYTAIRLPKATWP